MLIAVLASLIGVYYYFRIIIAMYFRESDGTEPVLQPLHQGVLIVACVLILGIGLLPGVVTGILE